MNTKNQKPKTTANKSVKSSKPPKSAAKPQKTDSKPKKSKTPRTKKQKIILAIIVTILVSLIIAVGVIFYFIIRPSEQAKNQRVEFPDPVYSVLTGGEISDAALNESPTYCIQIPNGADGGRPQAGLNQAGIVFEAIAERGITRFAAIFQNPTTSAIGPIRSLRPYYLDWDIPFDCTVVHAGGSGEAMAALHSSNQPDLNENLTYMWREQSGMRGWNNLFTSSDKLAQFSNDDNHTKSTVSAFPRLTPEEAEEIITENQTCPEEAEECEINYVSPSIKFGAMPSYNTTYTYDPETNTYARFYATGEAHTTYDCAAGLSEPDTYASCGEPVQIAPNVVIAMIVNEGQMSDGYHEDITTIGSGNAVIFQNGDAIEGTWTKSSQNSQIVFMDNSGQEIRFTPGQLWISVIPQYGSVSY